MAKGTRKTLTADELKQKLADAVIPPLTTALRSRIN